MSEQLSKVRDLVERLRHRPVLGSPVPPERDDMFRVIRLMAEAADLIEKLEKVAEAAKGRSIRPWTTDNGCSHCGAGWSAVPSDTKQFLVLNHREDCDWYALRAALEEAS